MKKLFRKYISIFSFLYCRLFFPGIRFDIINSNLTYLSTRRVDE